MNINDELSKKLTARRNAGSPTESSINRGRTMLTKKNSSSDKEKDSKKFYQTTTRNYKTLSNSAKKINESSGSNQDSFDDNINKPSALKKSDSNVGNLKKQLSSLNMDRTGAANSTPKLLAKNIYTNSKDSQLPESNSNINSHAPNLPQRNRSVISQASKLPQKNSNLNSQAPKLPERNSNLNSQAPKLPEKNSNLNSQAPKLPERSVNSPPPKIPQKSSNTPPPKIPQKSSNSPPPKIPQRSLNSPPPKIPQRSLNSPAPKIPQESLNSSPLKIPAKDFASKSPELPKKCFNASQLPPKTPEKNSHTNLQSPKLPEKNRGTCPTPPIKKSGAGDTAAPTFVNSDNHRVTTPPAVPIKARANNVGSPPPAPNRCIPPNKAPPPRPTTSPRLKPHLINDGIFEPSQVTDDVSVRAKQAPPSLPTSRHQKTSQSRESEETQASSFDAYVLPEHIKCSFVPSKFDLRFKWPDFFKVPPPPAFKDLKKFYNSKANK